MGNSDLTSFVNILLSSNTGESCFNLFKYAGNGQFSYEEDLYNPQEFLDMMEEWLPVWNGCKENAEKDGKHLNDLSEGAKKALAEHKAGPQAS